mmetsp:Transcript_42562/g.96836  ORF Transcript_42562/g.96836 Transcript_42562/m.96836 type:complete len:219 (+) Transcript_42562:969-1625(+)
MGTARRQEMKRRPNPQKLRPRSSLQLWSRSSLSRATSLWTPLPSSIAWFVRRTSAGPSTCSTRFRTPTKQTITRKKTTDRRSLKCLKRRTRRGKRRFTWQRRLVTPKECNFFWTRAQTRKTRTGVGRIRRRGLTQRRPVPSSRGGLPRNSQRRVDSTRSQRSCRSGFTSHRKTKRKPWRRCFAILTLCLARSPPWRPPRRWPSCLLREPRPMCGMRRN